VCSSDLAAAKAGFMVNDRILSLDGRTIARFEDIKRIVSLNQGTPIAAEIQRGEEHLSLTVTPEVSVQKDRFGGEHRLGRIGIGSSKIEYVKWSPPRAVLQAARECWTMSVDTLKAVGQMISGQRGSEEIGGPIRIAEMSGNVAKDGGWALLWFMAVISVNLGLINLFPVPLLDGGHLMFYVYERIFGRPMNEKVQDFGMRIGLGLIASLMLFATWNDLVHLEIVSKIKNLFS
jgi:regulator of sigma E protease